MQYRIFSKKHNRWWKANRCGYTVHENEAGIYSEVEAHQICLQSRMDPDPGNHSVMFPIYEVDYDLDTDDNGLFI